MTILRTTTLIIAGITFMVFDELIKSVEEASQAIDLRRAQINKRLIGSDLKRQVNIK